MSLPLLEAGVPAVVGSTANNGAVRRALTSSVAMSPELSVAHAVASQGEAIRSQLAVFLYDKHSRTADPLGKPRDMPEPRCENQACTCGDQVRIRIAFTRQRDHGFRECQAWAYMKLIRQIVLTVT